MCWSGEASAVVAAIGIGSTAYAMVRREPLPITASLGYFSLMELLQAVTYTVVDQCGSPLNQTLTFLGFVHIAFQPFFINWVSLYFVPEHVRRKVAPAVFSACFASSVLMLLAIYPFEWAGQCMSEAVVMCGDMMCSYMGSVHIAWMFPMNDILHVASTPSYAGQLANWWMYLIPAFIVPLVYGSWKMTLYHLIVGPVLAYVITGDGNEAPALWCLLSIGLLLIVVKTPVRGMLFVDRWFWWRRRADEPHEARRLPAPLPGPAE